MEQETAPRRAVEAGRERSSTNSKCMCTERLKMMMMKKKLKTVGLTSERSSRVKKTPMNRSTEKFSDKRGSTQVCFSKFLFHML